MKVSAAVCFLGVLVAAFAVAAVITVSGASAGEERDEAVAIAEAVDNDLDAFRSRPAATDAPEQLLAVMRELLDGRHVECETIVRLLLGFDEDAKIDEEQIFLLLLGLDGNVAIDRDRIAKILGVEADETVDCKWLFRTLLGLSEGEEIDNEQFVRLLLGIDENDALDTEQVVALLEHVVVSEKPGS